MKKLLILICMLSSLGLFAQKRVCIDPGHGYTSNWSNPDGRTWTENSTALDVGLKLHGKLGYCWSITSKMTRSTHTGYLSLYQRCVVSNSWYADRFLSIHCNAGGGTGTETFHYTWTSWPGKKYAGNIQNSMVKWGSWRNRGVKAANFYVLRNTNAWACLSEIGFVDHRSDQPKLMSNWWRNRFANAYVEGLKNDLGVSCWAPSTPGRFTVTVNGDCKDGNNFNQLTWTEAEGAQYYNIYRNGILYAKVEGTNYKNWSIGKDGSEFSYTVEAVCGDFSQVNDNGAVKVSNNACKPTTGVASDVETSLTLAPNPTRSDITLSIVGLPETSIKIEVYNIDGKIVMTDQREVTASGDFETRLDVTDLAPGNYVVKCRTENQVYSEKFTKQ